MEKGQKGRLYHVFGKNDGEDNTSCNSQHGHLLTDVFQLTFSDHLLLRGNKMSSKMKTKRRKARRETKRGTRGGTKTSIKRREARRET